MLSVKLWAPVTVSEDGFGWKADVPPGVNYSAIIPSDLSYDLPTRDASGTIKPPSQDASRHFGDPAVSHCRIEVDEKDAVKISAAVAESAVSEKDRLMVAMEEAVAREGRESLDLSRIDALFDGIEGLDTANAERKRDVKDVLLQAVARGLPAAHAETIRERLTLPETCDNGS